MSRQDDLEAAVAARRAFWSGIGDLERGVLAPLVSGHLMADLPPWPHAREAFVVVNREHSVVVATDGLSNPPDPDDPSERLGFEMYVEITDAGLDMAAVCWRPEFDVLQQLVFQVISVGGARVLSSLESHGVMSWEVRAKEAGDPFVGLGASGLAWGLLLSREHDDIPREIALPGGRVPLIAAAMIHGKELEYLVEREAEARRELARALAEKGYGWRTDLKRGPVLA